MSRFNIDFVILIKRNLYVDYIRNLRKKMEINKKAKMEQLYSLYESAVYAIAYSILNNVEQAEDVTQDTFLKIYSYLDDIEEVGSKRAKAFITKIVKNTAIDIYRKNQKISTYSENIEDTMSEDTDPANIVERQLVTLYKLDALDSAMSDISDYLRKIITMRYGYELKMTEIADILGKDSATIRKQMERARKYLAEKLENVTEDIR